MAKKRKNFMSDDPCVVCGLQGDGVVCFHHLFTQKVYPEFAHYDWNKIPVCQKCHNEFNNKATVYMAKKYPSVTQWLHKNDWFFCPTVKKWRRDGF